ncbi:MAG: glycosyltransferase family 2 protein, partial [Cyanobacteria bacterium REEB417]|nr:glycosyltransferase family 2 protein [Cyanobacteria bacterium REEB417]
MLGFSIGGVIGRTWIQRLGGHRRTRRFISVGSPQQGTLTARPWPRRLFKGLADLRQGSALLHGLNSDLDSLAGIDCHSFYSALDLAVLPGWRAVLPIGPRTLLPVATHPQLLPEAFDGAALRVSVLIPARNEAATLPQLLAALGRQSLPAAEVLVIDDHSRDGTGAVAMASAAAAGLPLRLIQAPPLPPGWCGKTWALHHGVATSSGDLLIFLDADTEPEPSLLASLVAQWQRLGGLVSVQPYHRTERPVVAVCDAGPARCRPGGCAPPPGANQAPAPARPPR